MSAPFYVRGRRDVRYEDLAAEIKAMRTEALAIGAEMRMAKHVEAPTICAVLRSKIASLYHQIQKARKEREELQDNYGSEPGFQE